MFYYVSQHARQKGQQVGLGVMDVVECAKRARPATIEEKVLIFYYRKSHNYDKDSKAQHFIDDTYHICLVMDVGTQRTSVITLYQCEYIYHKLERELHPAKSPEVPVKELPRFITASEAKEIFEAYTAGKKVIRPANKDGRKERECEIFRTERLDGSFAYWVVFIGARDQNEKSIFGMKPEDLEIIE